MSEHTDVSELLPHEIRICDAFLRGGGGMTPGQAYCTEFTTSSVSRIRAFFEREHIKDYILSQKQLIAEMCVVDLSRVIQELASIAFVNLKDIDVLNNIDTQGRMKARIMEELPDYQAAAVQSIKIKGVNGSPNAWVTEIKLHDKNKALEMLMRYMGAFEEDNRQLVSDPIKNILEHVAQRGLPTPPATLPAVVAEGVVDWDAVS